MIKYVKEDTSVCFAEIREEISLGLNLSCCPHRCPGCHSPYLQTNIGNELTIDIIESLIEKNHGITCVLFMGGDNDKETLKQFGSFVKSKNLKSAWYSGETELDLNEYRKYFDYIKVGPYIESLGPLNVKTTNQRLYQISNGTIEDITYTFWR
jgi:anaerobic ribonucleoside-triphosphate reductase activating protein